MLPLDWFPNCETSLGVCPFYFLLLYNFTLLVVASPPFPFSRLSRKSTGERSYLAPMLLFPKGISSRGAFCGITDAIKTHFRLLIGTHPQYDETSTNLIPTTPSTTLA